MYTMYMALHITNPVVEQKVRDMASVMGESITEAIGAAADLRMHGIKPSDRKRPKPTVEEILALVRSYNLTPINEGLTEDEILGYGPDGIPE